MGHYTLFHFAAEFARDSEILGAVQYLVDPQEIDRSLLPDHPLFNEGNRHKHFLISLADCTIFTHTAFQWNEDTKTYHLFVHSSSKDHGSEIALFLSWIKPHDVAGNGFRGYYQKDTELAPNLIFRAGDEYIMRKV